MATWKIVLISIAVVLVVAAIIAVTVILVLKKKKKQSVSTPAVKQEPEIIQLYAVKLLSGSGVFGYETEEELQARLSKLSKDEFKALDIVEYPYDENQWNSLEGKPEAIKDRNKYEMGIFFAYDYKKNLKSNGHILCRTF